MKSRQDFVNDQQYFKYLISYYSGLAFQALIRNDFSGISFVNLPSSDGSIEGARAVRSVALGKAMAEIVFKELGYENK